MSLSCLTCGQILQRVNSDRECLPEIKPCRKATMQVDRSWSGNMTPPQCARGAVAKIKTEHHRRTNSEGVVGPRLVRSSGMRRDWSFEDLSGQQDKGVRCY
ncbi:hypothetical protein E2542_SST15836 [Spatholobus suberectus]|nr:hypothetical protein E2542_SST15836 [Spatholobus suberectus]